MSSIPELITKSQTRTTEKLFLQIEKVERFRLKYGDEHKRTQFQIKKLEWFKTKLGHLTGYSI